MLGTRIAAGIFAALWAVLGFALVDLATVVTVDPRFIAVLPLEASWGSLFGYFVVAPLVFAAIVPRHWARVCAVITIAALSLAGAALASGDLGALLLAAAVLVTAAAVAALGVLAHRRRGGAAVVRLRFGPDWVLVVLAAVGIVLWWPYIVHATAGSLPTDITIGVDHWPVHAAAGIAVVVATVLAAITNGPRRIAGAAAAATATTIGVTMALSVGRPIATESAVWCVLAVLWGTAVLVSLLRTPRRGVRPRPIEPSTS